MVSGRVHVASFHISLPGVRLALWLGGGITVLAGLAARRRMRKAPNVDLVAAERLEAS